MNNSFTSMRPFFQYLLMLSFLSMPLGLMAQEVPTYEVRGVISDGGTGETLPFANVFFSGTTFGTVSDKDGVFTLKADGPGTYDLIISYTGYKPFKQQVVLNQSGVVEVVAKMEQRSRDISGVTVTADNNRRWKRLLRMFKTIFLGTSTNARACTILNEDILYLDYDENKGVFEAFASEPLIIENKALGYKITYVLESFKIYYREEFSAFSGYPSFEEMEGSKKDKKKWSRARNQAYYGSIEHFYRELYRGNTYDAGFRVKIARDKKQGRLIDQDIFYVDSLVNFSADSVRKELSFDDFIYVRYLHQSPDRRYIESLPASAPTEIRFATNQLSWIEMPSNESKVVFERSGLWVNPMAFITEGYWSFIKMGDLLPLDFQPGQVN